MKSVENLMDLTVSLEALDSESQTAMLNSPSPMPSQQGPVTPGSDLGSLGGFTDTALVSAWHSVGGDRLTGHTDFTQSACGSGTTIAFSCEDLFIHKR